MVGWRTGFAYEAVFESFGVAVEAAAGYAAAVVKSHKMGFRKGWKVLTMQAEVEAAGRDSS